MVKTAFLVTAGFAVGLALGFLVGSSDGGGGERPREEAALPAPGPAGEDEEREHEDGAAPPRARIAPASDNSAAERIAAVPVPAMERGTGTITGQVRTESGAPVEGVLVRAQLIHEDGKHRWRPSRGDEDQDLEAAVKEFIREEKRRRSERAEARSGADGTFVLKDLPEGASWWLQAFRKGYEISMEDQRRSSVKTGDQVGFLAQAMVEVTVSVLLPAGGPAPRATLLVQGSQGRPGKFQRQEEWTPDDPRLELPAGTAVLRASAGEDRMQSSSEVEVFLEPGSAPPEVVLQLRERPGILGKLIYDPSDEVRGVQVHLARTSPGSAPDPRRLCESGNNSLQREADTYSFQGLLPGTYFLGLSRCHGRIIHTEVVEVGDSAVERDLVVPPISPSDFLVLRVLGPGGDPVREVDVSTEARTENGGSSSGSGCDVRRPDGSILVPHRDWCGREGEVTGHSVTVRAAGYAEKKVEYRREETSELVIQLEEPAHLEVEVAGFAPEAYEGSFLLNLEKDRLENEGEEPGELRRFRHRSRMSSEERGELLQGRARFGPVDAGSYRVVLRYRARRGEYPVQSVPVTLRPGRNQASVPMPRLFSLRVHTAGAPQDATINLRPSAGEEAERWTVGEEVGEDLQVLFGALPAGDYELTLHGAGEGTATMTVNVPAQTELQFQARKNDAMRTRIADAEGPAARAGLQTGDLIIGLDGTGFESRRQWGQLLQKVSRQETVRVQAIRGGEVFEVTLRPQDLRRIGLEPASR